MALFIGRIKIMKFRYESYEGFSKYFAFTIVSLLVSDLDIKRTDCAAFFQSLDNLVGCFLLFSIVLYLSN